MNNPAYRNWLRKLGTQILRISLVLHGIECSYDPDKNKRVIAPDTFSRAIKFGVYYSHTFDLIQDKISDGSEVTSILVRIHDLALSNPTGGVTIRECARRIRALTHNAKELGVSVGTYTRTLIENLVKAGKGSLLKVGQALKYQAQIFTNGIDGNNGTSDPGDLNGGLPKNPVSPNNSPINSGEPLPSPEVITETIITMEIEKNQIYTVRCCHLRNYLKPIHLQNKSHLHRARFPHCHPLRKEKWIYNHHVKKI